MAGARSAAVRSTGASSTWRTSARSSASGPPWLPDRRPTASATAATTPIQAGPSDSTWSSWLAVSGLSPIMLEPTTTTTTPTMPVRYAWYRRSIQWTSSVRA